MVIREDVNPFRGIRLKFGQCCFKREFAGEWEEGSQKPENAVKIRDKSMSKMLKYARTEMVAIEVGPSLR